MIELYFMEKLSFTVFLLISFAAHICVIFFVSGAEFKPVEDQALQVEIASMPTQKKHFKENRVRKSSHKPKRMKTPKKNEKKPRVSHVRTIRTSGSHEYGKRPSQKREDTILLNTKKSKYVSYSSRIKRKLELAWEYPIKAREKEIQGRLTLMFSILEDGKLAGILLVQSSGFQILDDGAMRAVKFAAPFYPIPRNMGIDKLNIITTFEYRMDYFP